MLTELLDFREAPGEGTYDKLVSCEMIEAVGEEHLDSFFKCIGKMLKPGGIAVLQAISVPDERCVNCLWHLLHIHMSLFTGFCIKKTC